MRGTGYLRINMRKPAWDALHVLCAGVPEAEVPEFVVPGLATHCCKSTGTLAPPWLMRTATLAGVAWDMTHGEPNMPPSGLVRSRYAPDGRWFITHTFDILKTHLEDGQQAALDPDMCPLLEHVLVRRAKYACDMHSHIKSGLGLDLLPNMYGAIRSSGSELYPSLVAAADRQAGVPNPIIAAGTLLRSTSEDDIPPVNMIFSAAPLALLALAEDNSMTLEARAAQARAIVALAESRGVFAAKDDARFNLAERFLALGRGRLCLVSVASAAAAGAAGAGAADHGRMMRGITQRAMAVWQPLVEACARLAPGYLANSHPPDDPGIAPDALSTPWRGLLLDVALFEACGREAYPHVRGALVACAAEILARTCPSDPSLAGFLQARWLMLERYIDRGRLTPADLIAARDVNDPMTRYAFKRHLSRDPCVARGLWQYAYHLASTAGHVVNGDLVCMLEVACSTLPVAGAAQTTRMLDTMLAMDWHAWVLSLSMDHTAACDTYLSADLSNNLSNDSMTQGRNDCVARLCLAALPRLTVVPAHDTQIRALQLMFAKHPGETAVAAPVRALLADARVLAAINTEDFVSGDASVIAGRAFEGGPAL